MNIFQKIILITGAIVFVIVIWTSPQMDLPTSGPFSDSLERMHLEIMLAKGHKLDVGAAFVRGISVVVVVAVLFFVTKTRHKKQD